jgi:Nif-specific regulatory protein
MTAPGEDEATESDGWRVAHAVRRLLEAADVASVYAELLSCIGEVTHAKHGFAAVVDPERDGLVPVARLGDATADRLAFDDPLAARGMTGGRPTILSADDAACAAHRGGPIVERAARVLLVPLVTPERAREGRRTAIQGLLCLQSTDARAFDALPERVLTEIAGAASLLLARKQTQAAREEELSLLWDVKRGIVDLGHDLALDEANLSELVAKILRVALARTRTQTGGIFLLDEDTGDLVIEQQAIRGDHVGHVPERFRRLRGDQRSGILFWVIEHNRPYRTGDVTRDPYYIPFFESIRSNLTVPISFQERAIGAIAVESVAADAFDDADEQALVDLARSATMFIRRAQLYRETRREGRGPRGGGILIKGSSPEWIDIEQRIERAAATDATVLVRGESGTGKELIAHAIHFNSRRAKRPFVVVNAGAIPEALLESELFGHVRGAFTGAVRDKPGQIELAHGGTLFLDEIGDLAPQLQVKLLRALETGDIHRVGDPQPSRRVDVRIIAATNRDLESMMRDGTFRADLYFRLNVVPIWVPPLRRYRDSIPSIARTLVEELGRVHRRPARTLSQEVVDVLLHYAWPGNVRELRNCLERAVVVEDSESLRVGSLPLEVRKAAASAPPARGDRGAAEDDDRASEAQPDAPYHDAREACVRRFEREYVVELMARSGGNVSRAAAAAGLSRVNLYRLLRRHGMHPRG